MAEGDPYAPLRLKNQLCYPIYLCAKELVRSYGPLLDRLNLTYTQYIVMMYFWEMGQSSQKQISQALLLDPSTLTPVLKKLEAKGYITRSRSEEDGRSLDLTLTPQGEQLRDEALPIPGQIGACVGLEKNEAETLYALIKKIMTNLIKENDHGIS